MPRKKQNVASPPIVIDADVSSQDGTEQVANEVVKRRRVGNPAINGEALNISPTENTKYILNAMHLMNLPDIDLHDPVQVRNRINEYIQFVADNGNKPTVSGLGLALNGMSRQQLWEIRTGKYQHGGPPFGIPNDCVDIIKRTYKLMEELWENYMQNGKINPASGIFLGKNHFGYVDQQDVVITPNNPLQNLDNDTAKNRLLEATAEDE